MSDTPQQVNMAQMAARRIKAVKKRTHTGRSEEGNGNSMPLFANSASSGGGLFGGSINAPGEFSFAAPGATTFSFGATSTAPSVNSDSSAAGDEESARRHKPFQRPSEPAASIQSQRSASPFSFGQPQPAVDAQRSTSPFNFNFGATSAPQADGAQQKNSPFSISFPGQQTFQDSTPAKNSPFSISFPAPQTQDSSQTQDPKLRESQQEHDTSMNDGSPRGANPLGQSMTNTAIPPPVFSFGASTNNTASTPAKPQPSFVFGSAAQSNMAPAASSSSAPSFAFGSPSQSQPASPITAPTFSFAPEAQKPSSFTFGSTTTKAQDSSRPASPAFVFGSKPASTAAPSSPSSIFGLAPSANNNPFAPATPLERSPSPFAVNAQSQGSQSPFAAPSQTEKPSSAPNPTAAPDKPASIFAPSGQSAKPASIFAAATPSEKPAFIFATATPASKQSSLFGTSSETVKAASPLDARSNATENPEPTKSQPVFSFGTTAQTDSATNPAKSVFNFGTSTASPQVVDVAETHSPQMPAQDTAKPLFSLGARQPEGSGAKRNSDQLSSSAAESPEPASSIFETPMHAYFQQVTDDNVSTKPPARSSVFSQSSSQSFTVAEKSSSALSAAESSTSPKPAPRLTHPNRANAAAERDPLAAQIKALRSKFVPIEKMGWVDMKKVEASMPAGLSEAAKEKYRKACRLIALKKHAHYNFLANPHSFDLVGVMARYIMVRAEIMEEDKQLLKERFERYRQEMAKGFEKKADAKMKQMVEEAVAAKWAAGEIPPSSINWGKGSTSQSTAPSATPNNSENGNGPSTNGSAMPKSPSTFKPSPLSNSVSAGSAPPPTSALPSISTPKAAPPTMFAAQTPAVSSNTLSSSHTPGPSGKRKADVQLTKDDPTGEESGSPAKKQIRTNKEASSGSATSQLFKDIVSHPDSPDKENAPNPAASSARKIIPVSKSSTSDTPRRNPFASLPLPASPSVSASKSPSPAPSAASVLDSASSIESRSVNIFSHMSAPKTFTADMSTDDEEDDNVESEDEGDEDADKENVSTGNEKHVVTDKSVESGTPVKGKGNSDGATPKPTNLFNFGNTAEQSKTPAKTSSIFNFGSSTASGTKTPTISSGGLFDRIAKDKDGNAIRCSTSPEKQDSTTTPSTTPAAAGSSLFGASTAPSNLFGASTFGSGNGQGSSSMFGSKAVDASPARSSPSSKPVSEANAPTDNTWNPDTPIKFGASTAPTVTVEGPTPTKSSPFAGFGNVSTTPKTPSLFAGLNKDGASPSTSSSSANPEKPVSPFAGFGADKTPQSTNVEKPAASIFTGFGGNTSSSSSATNSTGATSSLFAGLNTPKLSASGSAGNDKSAPSLFSFGPSTTAAPSAPSIFSGFGSSKPETTSTPTASTPSIFASLNTSKPAVGFSFGGSSAAPLLFPSAHASDINSRATTPGATTENDTADEAGGSNDPDAEKHAQIDLTSGGAGEEEEEATFNVRAKAMKWTTGKSEGDKPEWVTRGIGPLKVLKHKETGASRVLMRADPSGALVLNRSILRSVDYAAVGKTVKLMTADDSGKGLETWLLQVKTAESATELAASLEASKAS